jgi:hypothetical protein
LTLLARKNTVPSRNGIVIHFEKRIYVLSRRQFLTSTLAAGMALKASAQPAKRIIVDALEGGSGLEGPRHEAADA